jgi:hypothetical protein
MIPYEIGLIVFLLCIVTSRIMLARAQKTLTQEQKAAFLDKMTGLTAYGLIPLVVLVCIYFVVARYATVDRQLLVWFYLGAMLVLIVINQWLVARRVREANLDPRYMRIFFLSRIVSFSGIAVFILTLIPV